jgi:hypothetical protein
MFEAKLKKERDDFELMQLHTQALFTHNSELRLLFVNEPNGAPVPAPRLFLGRTGKGNIWRFRTDVSGDIVKELELLCAQESPIEPVSDKVPCHLDAFVRLLEKQSPIEKIWGGPAYQFTGDEKPSKDRTVTVTSANVDILQNGFEDLMDDVSVEQPFVALTGGNRAVSVCRSVRVTPQVHEAGLETLPQFRGHGYAKEVTAEWARRVRSIGAIPLYSTSWDNKASQSVARKLNLKCYGTDFEIF